jgi:hypothetical protein
MFGKYFTETGHNVVGEFWNTYQSTPDAEVITEGIIVESPQWATSIRTLAFVRKAVTLPTDTQDVFVIVQDQAYAPVPNATGFIIVHQPVGGDQTFAVATDINGIGVVHNVTFTNQPPGSLVELFVEMRLGDLKDSTMTSFRIWC